MKRNSTRSSFLLFFLCIVTLLIPAVTQAHELTNNHLFEIPKNQPSKEEPRFFSPSLFIFQSQKPIVPPFKPDDNIISWGDAFVKGLPVIKVGGVGTSYNEFLKKWKTDSVKVEAEGSVDCIRYKIKPLQDSITVDSELEFLVTAEFIEGIPYAWQQRDCGDFCIKVFFPEGFVQTGGDYKDFEGFSLRPGGVTHIERKIKGRFVTEITNPCFMLTKGAKFYDPQYLLEIKQNVCVSFPKKAPVAEKKETLIAQNRPEEDKKLTAKDVVHDKNISTPSDNCAVLSTHKPEIEGSTNFCIEGGSRVIDLKATSCVGSIPLWFRNNNGALIALTSENGKRSITASDGSAIEGVLYVVCKADNDCCYSKISEPIFARTRPVIPVATSNNTLSLKAGTHRAFTAQSGGTELIVKRVGDLTKHAPNYVPIAASYMIYYEQSCNSNGTNYHSEVLYDNILTDNTSRRNYYNSRG